MNTGRARRARVVGARSGGAIIGQTAIVAIFTGPVGAGRGAFFLPLKLALIDLIA